MRTHQRTRGFTLIELLVAIAIIATLASLLLGGLAQAKASARSAKCKSNLRQLSLALQMYIGDYHRYPTFYRPTSGLSDTNWLTQSEPYLGSLASLADLRRCPGDPKSPDFTTYGYNFRGIKQVTLFGDVPIFGLGLGGDMDQQGVIHATPENGVKSPSQ